MKYFLFFLLILGLSSCQDSKITEVIPKTITKNQSKLDFLVFNTKDELQNSIKFLKRNKNIHIQEFASTRANVTVPDTFVSLLENNKLECLSQLTAEQLDSIKNDPDQLEYCLSDSVIADYEFAKLLNEYRMIEVEGVVYRYFPDCVAYTNEENAEALKKLPFELKPAPTEEELRIKIGTDGIITVIPNKYKEEESKEETKASDKEGLRLKNGVVIPLEDIREVNYNSKGDGSLLV